MHLQEVILPGGGIHAQNVISFKEAGFVEIHASASISIQGIEGLIPMQNLNSLQKHLLTYSDTEKIKGILNAINR